MYMHMAGYSLYNHHVTETLCSNGKIINIIYKFTEIYLWTIKLYLSHSWVAFLMNVEKQCYIDKNIETMKTFESLPIAMITAHKHTSKYS